MSEEKPLHDECDHDDKLAADTAKSILSLDQETQQRVQTVCLLVLAVLGATYLVYWLRPVLVPFVVALFVVSGLSPILSFVERALGVTRIVAAAITFLSGVGLLIIFGAAIVISMSDLTRNSQRYIDRIEQIAREIEELSIKLKLTKKPTQSTSEEEQQPATDEKERFDETTSDAAATTTTTSEADDQIPANIDPATTSQSAPTSEQADSINSQDAPAGKQPQPVASQDDGSLQLVESIARQGIAVVSQSLVNLISMSVVVLIFVFFLMLGTPSMLASSSTIREINHQVRSYLALKTIISVFTGVAFGLALRIFGVPMAFTFGVLAFLLNYVPNVGPIVASILPIPLIIFDPTGSIIWMVAAITVTSMIQVMSGNIVEPKIMGNSADLHPVIILLSLMFWGMMWGVIGMFLATPIAAGFKIVLERFDETKPIAAFMAGRSVGESPRKSKVEDKDDPDDEGLSFV